MQIGDLLDVLAISCGDPRTFDAHFGVIVLPFPYFAKISRGDWVIAKLSEAAGDNLRRWKDPVVAANGLQLEQTQSGNIVGGRDDVEGLESVS